MKSKNIMALIISLALISPLAINQKVRAINITEVINSSVENYKEIPTKYNVPKTKNFEIKFNKEISFTSINSNTVKVVDSKGNEIPVKLTAKAADKTIVIVESPAGGYKDGETYTLIIKKGISSLNSFNLTDETVMKFVIADSNSGNSTGETITAGITLNSQNEIIAKYNKDINQATFNISNIAVKDSSGNKQYIEISFIDNKTIKISSSKVYPLAPGTYTLDMSNLKYKDGLAIASVSSSFKVAGEEQNSVLQVVKDFNGGKLYKEHYLSFYATSGDYLKEGQWYPMKQAFYQKYNSPKYNYITNLDYYKNINGLTINFDRVNNSNKLLYGNVPLASPRYLGLPNADAFWIPETNYHQNKVASAIVWRPDMEQELALLINEERRKGGLKEVKIDSNLSAIAKWASKRQHLATSYQETQKFSYENYKNEYFDLNIKVPTLQENMKGIDDLINAGITFKAWSQDITPFMDAEGNEYYLKGFSYVTDKEIMKKYMYRRLENDIYKLFDYPTSKKVYTVKYNTIFQYDAEGLMKRFKDNPYLGYTSGKWYNPRIEDRTGYYVVNIMNIIKNPNITKIGIGCLYQSPTSKYNVNGMTGVYMLAE